MLLEGFKVHVPWPPWFWLLRKSFKTLQSRIINYWSYKSLSNKKFKSSLLNELRKENPVNINECFEKFCNISLNVLNKHAPREKKKISRGNQMPFMPKYLSKGIRKRSRLRNRFLKKKSLENKMLYTQQINYCVSILKKTQFRY